MRVMSAFTLAEIDATLTRLKAEYEKLNHMEEYGLGGRAESPIFKCTAVGAPPFAV